MNKKIRNALLIFGAFILIAFLPKEWFISEHATNNESSTPIISSQSQTEVERIDTINKRYSNFKYGFAIDFPDHWNMRNGLSKNTIVSGECLDSAITFSVVVIDPGSPDEMLKYNIWNLWDMKELYMDQVLQNNLEQATNQEIHNLEFRKVHVSNWEAIEATYTFLDRRVDYEVKMRGISHSIMKHGYTYTLGLILPQQYYSTNQEYYNKLIHSFVLMNSDRTPKQ